MNKKKFIFQNKKTPADDDRMSKLYVGFFFITRYPAQEPTNPRGPILPSNSGINSKIYVGLLRVMQPRPTTSLIISKECNSNTES